MDICLKLKEDYLKEIKKIEDRYKKNSKRLAVEEAKDEAILEDIKVNIIDIFLKMFDISFNKACSNKGNEYDKMEKLKDEYFKFFDKISTPWRVKMTKDKEHNMMEEYYKEEIKIQVADDMKNRFIEHYNKLCKEE